MAAKFLIDTNIWIHYFKKKYGVGDKMALVSADDIAVSEITIAELTFGAYHSSNFFKHIKEVYDVRDNFLLLPISNSLDEYGRIRNKMFRQGLSVENFDLLIAATALHYGLILVTENIKHFDAIPDLRIENWANRML